MPTAQFELSPRTGVIAVGLLAIVLVVRLATVGEVKDAELEAAIHLELANHRGGALGRAIEELEDVNDEAAIEQILELSTESGVDLHSVAVSKPLLSFSSDSDAVVRVEFSLPGEQRTTAYWYMSDGLIGGWRYRYEANAVAYYLNFF